MNRTTSGGEETDAKANAEESAQKAKPEESEKGVTATQTPPRTERAPIVYTEGSAVLSEASAASAADSAKTILKEETTSEPAENFTAQGLVRHRPASPPRNPVSNLIHIRQLRRPFTVEQLQALLKNFGTLVEEDFWIDSIRSNCIAKFESEGQAKQAREDLHNAVWPVGSDTSLIVEFSTDEKLARQRGEGSRKRKASDDKPTRTLDAIFKKTTTLPAIYYLPKTKEEDQDSRRSPDSKRRRRDDYDSERLLRDTTDTTVFALHPTTRKEKETLLFVCSDRRYARHFDDEKELLVKENDLLRVRKTLSLCPEYTKWDKLENIKLANDAILFTDTPKNSTLKAVLFKSAFFLARVSGENGGRIVRMTVEQDSSNKEEYSLKCDGSMKLLFEKIKPPMSEFTEEMCARGRREPFGKLAGQILLIMKPIDNDQSPKIRDIVDSAMRNACGKTLYFEGSCKTIKINRRALLSFAGEREDFDWIIKQLDFKSNTSLESVECDLEKVIKKYLADYCGLYHKRETESVLELLLAGVDKSGEFQLYERYFTHSKQPETRAKCPEKEVGTSSSSKQPETRAKCTEKKVGTGKFYSTLGEGGKTAKKLIEKKCGPISGELKFEDKNDVLKFIDQVMLQASRDHSECSHLHDVFIIKKDADVEELLIRGTQPSPPRNEDVH